jgi:hypothetical protein
VTRRWRIRWWLAVHSRHGTGPVKVERTYNVTGVPLTWSWLRCECGQERLLGVRESA